MMQMKRLLRRSLVATTLFSALLFSACEKSGDDPQPLALSDLSGSYSGTFDFTPSPSDINPSPVPERGVAVSLRVDDGRIVFPEFPAATLVKALLGEEGAAGLIPMLGTIAYEAEILPTASDAATLRATLSTPVLRLDLAGVLVVLILVDAPDALHYAADGSLRFTLRTVQCQLGEGEMAGEPFALENTLVFDVAKQ